MARKKKKVRVRNSFRWSEISSFELRSICDSNPDHPLSTGMRARGDGKGDLVMRIVPTVMIEAIKQNREFQEIATNGKTWRDVTHQLGESYGDAEEHTDLDRKADDAKSSMYSDESGDPETCC